MSTIEVRLQFFGALRDFGSTVALRVPEGITVAALKEHAVREMNREGLSDLISVCAVGSDTEILRDTSRIGASCELALLPPVCGGSV